MCCSMHKEWHFFIFCIAVGFGVVLFSKSCNSFKLCLKILVKSVYMCICVNLAILIVLLVFVNVWFAVLCLIYYR